MSGTKFVKVQLAEKTSRSLELMYVDIDNTSLSTYKQYTCIKVCDQNGRNDASGNWNEARLIFSNP